MLQIRPNETTGVSSAINELEQKLQIVFPQDYKQFLIKYNGGWTPNTLVYFSEFDFGLNSLYGLAEAKRGANISHLMDSGVSSIQEEFYQSLSEGMFTIGDWFGAKYYIGVIPNSEYYGKTFYMNEERLSYCYVADSFTDFVYLAKTPDFYVGTVEENTQRIIARGWENDINEDIIEMWEERYEKYKDLRLIPVEL